MKKSMGILGAAALAIALSSAAATVAITKDDAVNIESAARTPEPEAVVPPGGPSGAVPATVAAPGGSKAAPPPVVVNNRVNNQAGAAAEAKATIPGPPPPAAPRPKDEPKPDPVPDRPGDQAPVANADWFTVHAGTPATLDVLQNDYDPDHRKRGSEGVYIVNLQERPAQGELDLLGGKHFVFHPPADYSGTLQFVYVLTDGDSMFSNGRVTLQVVPASTPAPAPVTTDPGPGTSTTVPMPTTTTSSDQAPVAIDDQGNIHNHRDDLTMVEVLANDHDPGGGGVEIVSFTQPAFGRVTFDTDRHLTYRTSGNGFVGEDSFQYTIRDTDGGTELYATATVRVNVLAPQGPPTSPSTAAPSTTAPRAPFTCSTTNEGNIVVMRSNRADEGVTVAAHDAATGLVWQMTWTTDPEGGLNVQRPDGEHGWMTFTSWEGNGCRADW